MAGGRSGVLGTFSGTITPPPLPPPVSLGGEPLTLLLSTAASSGPLRSSKHPPCGA